MILNELKPRKALNKAFLKVKPNRTEIESFKTNLITLLDRTNDTESEEFHKNLVIDFLKKTYYDPNHFINTKGRNDLVIHNGPNADSTVGVIIEAKKPTNKVEMPQAFANTKINKQTGEQMITTKRLNVKAIQELVLYYLRERITHKNLEIKHLVATNINEWFIFDAILFDRLFAQNKNLVKQFNDFSDGRLADIKTDFFYKQIAEPYIDSISSEIAYTYFNFQDFQKPIRNADKGDDNSLIALFKLLSPEHLLKLPFTNDSNSLDKRFYSELLHIIGLAETKEGSKKLIQRNKAGERHTGTIIEDAIIQLDSLDKIRRLEKPNQFGKTQEERLFNVALELTITWINRILFLKLLEAQLITYHKGDKSYSFLNFDKINNYDDLNSLFFQVLARKYDERNEDVKKAFEKVPYLNSSLFEPTDIEQVTLFISNLKDDKTIPIFTQTILKDQQGKKQTGHISTLQYLFEFLDAYDFGAEGGEEIQEDNKTLINASVLGLIFEKINGYKDGSFFTPGFITMYMCRETIRKAVVEKFNEYCFSPLSRGDGSVSSPLLRGAGGVSSPRLRGVGGVFTHTDNIHDEHLPNPPQGDEHLPNPPQGDEHLPNPPQGGNAPLLRGAGGVFTHIDNIQDEHLPNPPQGGNAPLLRGAGGVFTHIDNIQDEHLPNPPQGDEHLPNPPQGGKHLPNPPQGDEHLPNPPQGGKAPLLRGAGGVSSPLSRRTRDVSRRIIIPYNPKLKELARALRNNSTKSEIILWKQLKGKFGGKYDFHRQKPLDEYIADFFCYELSLVIEIDGSSHNLEEVQAKDKVKEARFNELGLNVLRFSDDNVFHDLDGVLEIIWLYVQGFEKGDLSELVFEDSPLNAYRSKEDDTPPAPLERGGEEGDTPLSIEGDTPPAPLKRGGEEEDTPPAPLKRGEERQYLFKTIDDIYEQIGEGRLISRKKANEIINSLKICDPAVGSGHFLVSALNEIIAIKNDLKVLQDRDGKSLHRYEIEVVNDELSITDEDGNPFKYIPGNRESQRVQEALFHEKQTIIENCLFGVDINPNSVKICRLRLWIELLKNAYYKHLHNPPQGGNAPLLRGDGGVSSLKDNIYDEHLPNPPRGGKHLPDPPQGGKAPLLRGAGGVLETLPNIDINIKCGNSLVSRFAIDADLKQALKKSKWTIDSYRIAVDTYRNAENKEQKREMEQLIADIKSDFRSEISHNDVKVKKLRKLSGELFQMTNQQRLFEMSPKEKADWNKKVQQLTEEIKKIETEIEEIKANKIFENAFEWRFEFPEVLNDEGDFVGFDVVIGNPPYVYRNADIENVKNYFNSNYYNTSGNYDLYKFFIEQSIRIAKQNGFNSLITNSSFLLQTSFDKTRKFLLNNSTLKNIVPLGGSVFEEATVDSAIYILQKSKNYGEETLVINPQKPIDVAITPAYAVKQDRFLENEFLVFDYLLNDKEYNIVNKLISNFPKIETAYEFGVGINTGYIKDELTADSKLDIRYHPMVPGTGVSKYGKIKTDGFIMYDKEFVKSKGKLGRTLPDEKFFIEPKLLIVRTRNISLRKRIIASIDYDKKYNLNRISNIISKGDNSLEGLLGILNSKLFNWLYSKRYFDYEIKPIYLRNSPLCDTNNKELNNLVKEIISLRNSDDMADITRLTNQIDQLVYQLYDLTEEEIKIIENN